MKRFAMEKLIAWKGTPGRKPLIIQGARQVGKTWLMKEFGKSAFDKTVYINFDNNSKMNQLFKEGYDVKRLIMGIELFAGHKIDAENTLVIFDEVQECPEAMASLKYFCEDAPEYHITCAGSLLGIALHRGTTFPVGKVQFMDLYPLSFYEFLTAMGKDAYVSVLQDLDFNMAENFRQEYIDLLKNYFYIGGMPEVVNDFVQNRDFNRVRSLQQDILTAYEQDYSKHAPANEVPRIRMLWNSLPSQLAKENKKFIYGLVREGARAKDYETSLLWLEDCGLIHKVKRINAPKLPLKAYEDLKAFKLFIHDIGLLSCMTGLRQSVLAGGNDVFVEFKGALTEQYVLQQLKTIEDLNVYYWTNGGATSEVDFVIDDGEKIVPLEVKAESNLKGKSLKVYRDLYEPEISIRTSMSNYKNQGWMFNLPLYAIGSIGRCIK